MKKDFCQFTRDYLLRDFGAKKGKNPSYSLRAYARSLEIDSSLLSKVMQGKRPISKKLAAHAWQKLKLGSNDTLVRTTDFQKIELDYFRMIADWYHFAILELTQVYNFKPDIPWIARHLSLPESVIQDAADRLFRLDFLKKGIKGQWIPSAPTSTVSHQFTEPALKLLQKQILEQAIEALQKVAFAERDQSAITMCIDSRKLPEAKERIKKFRRQLMKFLESSKKRDRVYQMSIALFPVSHAG